MRDMITARFLRRFVGVSLGVLVVAVGLTGCGKQEPGSAAAPIEPVATTAGRVEATPVAPTAAPTISPAELPASTVPENSAAPESRTYDSPATDDEIRSALGIRDNQVIGTGGIFGDPFDDEILTTVLDVRSAATSTDSARQGEGRHSLVISTGSSQDTKRVVTATVEVELMEFEVLSLSHGACRIGDQPAKDALAILSPEFNDGVPALDAQRWNATKAWRVGQGELIEIPEAQSVSCELAGE